MLKVRASELAKLMTKSRSKSSPLSETTKSWIKEKVKEHVFGYKIELDNKYVQKGIQSEVESIELLNTVTFESYAKNTVRNDKDWLTGEPDIVCENEIIDIKTSFSLDTFPVFKEDADKNTKKSGYDWQLRAYMRLFDRWQSRICYCMVSTPQELLNDWDDMELHIVDHIEPNKRITFSSVVERDLEKEKEMDAQYKLANAYYLELINEFEEK